MQFTELKDGLKKINFDSLRVDSEDYFEAVVLSAELSKLTACLNSCLGPPAWPSQQALSLDVEKAIDGFGGIMPGQTLYFTSQAGGVVFVMLWPWQDGVHTTLKAVKQ